MTTLLTGEPASLLTLALLVWVLSGVGGWVVAAITKVSSLIFGAGSMVAALCVIVAAIQILQGSAAVQAVLPVLPFNAN